MKKIYQKEDGEFTLSEYTDEKMNRNIIPPKFSPEDKYGEYRRKATKAKEEE